MLGTILLIVGGLICAALGAAAMAFFVMAGNADAYLDHLSIDDDQDANP